MSSQAEQRAALVAAVDGITAIVGSLTVTVAAHPTLPATPQAYDAWPVWTATRPTAMCVDETDWQVVLALPGSDPQTWSAMGDALLEEIADALAAYDLTRIEPVQILLTEGQSMPGLAYNLTI